ncbi:MAG: LacI family DNA-binding transcriptional regulator, partial [Varibaculum cambriense]
MSSRLATQSDVARVAGTSTAVVSYVVNGGPRPVASETRDRVLAAIEKTGYRPNNAARTLLTGKSSTLGMVIPDLTNPFLSHMVQ